MKCGAPARWAAEVDMALQFFDLVPMQIVWQGMTCRLPWWRSWWKLDVGGL